jgi:GWxTD domain-containing protein
MKYLLVFSLLFSTVIFCQPERQHRDDNRIKDEQLRPTILVLPGSDSEILFSYLYRIPYNQLIFERNGNSFESSVRILVEVYEDDDELIKREYVDKKVSVNDFDIVKSKSASIQGIINFNLSNKKYTVRGAATDLNSQKEIIFNKIEFNGNDPFTEGVYNPIIINPATVGCNGKTLPLIVNQKGAIPFSSNSYQLIIPVADTSVKTIHVEIINNGQDSSTQTINEFFTGNILAMECDGLLFIGEEEKNIKTNNFILRNTNKNMHEGILVVKVKLNEDDYAGEFPLIVSWDDKPFSLRNPEFAIQMLKYIEDESVLSKMLAANEKEYPKLLDEYWEKFDPTPETEFNELMEEYYSRIDYAAREFSGISRKNGISSDRGKIYIKNGRPDSIDRSSDEHGFIVEIWKYNVIKKIFQFVDKQGTGNFILIEG